jgi:hypothetical protein
LPSSFKQDSVVALEAGAIVVVQEAAVVALIVVVLEMVPAAVALVVALAVPCRDAKSTHPVWRKLHADIPLPQLRTWRNR